MSRWDCRANMHKNRRVSAKLNWRIGLSMSCRLSRVFFFQAEDGIRDYKVTGVQTCALPIYMVDPVIGFDIPGKPRTTASTITSTMTPATSRMKEGMTGANAPQDLFEVESVIIFYT